MRALAVAQPLAAARSLQPLPLASLTRRCRPRKPVLVVERTPKQIADDLAKLALVRKRREEDAQRRITQEGFDRFAPKDKAVGEP